ncbi:response regulator transcription factor [Streptomyces montanus]|uniref:Response regulator transcription factor n=1 Tax=Streptomyces montanus TaxID=2580423 RepID=A0A5R9G9K8_9ACTN|nr:response regulator transcription factor [Streptomyces montanus]TLS48125.1 response regulator transcription factor [Streptomyces montanus]
MIRVLIADGEPPVRCRLRRIVESDGLISVVAEAGNGADAIATTARCRPEVVLMDVHMPGVEGLTAAARIAAAPAAPKVVMLTTFDLDEHVHQALRAGVVGFLLKDTPPRELTAAIHAVSAGHAMLTPRVTRRLIDHFTEHGPARSVTAREQLAALTHRELQVVRAVAQGLSNMEIGRHLTMTEATVKTYVSRALSKLGLTNRVQAALLARDAGLV